MDKSHFSYSRNDFFSTTLCVEIQNFYTARVENFLHRNCPQQKLSASTGSCGQNFRRGAPAGSSGLADGTCRHASKNRPNDRFLSSAYGILSSFRPAVFLLERVGGILNVYGIFIRRAWCSAQRINHTTTNSARITISNILRNELTPTARRALRGLPFLFRQEREERTDSRGGFLQAAPS